MSRSGAAQLTTRALLALGFVALAGAVVLAHYSPATGYEVSIYEATPASVWILLGIALAVSLTVSIGTVTDLNRRLALCLGGGTILTVVGMPVLRGYWFISGGDALTHLGWARGIEAGAFHPTELRYPGLHTGSTMVASAVGVDLAHAMLLFIIVLFGLYLLFVTLSTSLVLDRPYATTVGAFSAFLLLPITNLSMFVTPHTMSQAVLFSAVVIYLLFSYVRSGSSSFVTPTGGLLSVGLVALVLYHPQLAAHLLAVLVGVCIVQFMYRRYSTSHPVTAHRPIYGQTVFLGIAFLVWVTNHEFVREVATFHLASTIDFFVGDDVSAGDSVETQGESLAAIGGSVLEVALKLLGPSLGFGLLTVLLLAWLFVVDDGRLDTATDGLFHYFVVALITLVSLFGVYFFGSSGQMYFRVFGFAMLFVTITGAVAIAYSANAVSRSRIVPGHGVIAVGFGILLVVSLLALFPSPYIYNTSPHVTEQSMSGHEQALDAAVEDVQFDGIRSGPNRYADATAHSLDRTRIHGSIEGEEISEGIAGQYEEDRYLTVSQQDWEREVGTYQGLRYTDEQLRSVPEQPDVNRISSNGELDVYYVHSGAD